MNFSDDGIVPFATADPHYFHRQINQYCKRPFRDEKDMRNTLIENYNKTVPSNGLCFFIGDTLSFQLKSKPVCNKQICQPIMTLSYCRRLSTVDQKFSMNYILN